MPRKSMFCLNGTEFSGGRRSMMGTRIKCIDKFHKQGIFSFGFQ
jgi:hypothetical protein